MKEHPMLFSGPLVRAILEGRKTVTRRPVDHTNCIVNGEKRWSRERFARFPLGKAWVNTGPSPAGNPGPYLKCDSMDPDDGGAMARLYPPWSVGDRIWVKETVSIHRWVEPGGLERSSWYYVADGVQHDGVKLTPSIHMPRWASRLTLEITRVRAERLQAITDDEAVAEGAVFTDYGLGQWGRQNPGWTMEPPTTHTDQCLSAPRWAFSNLWEKIYGTWDANPWVWALDFRVVTP